MGGFPFPSNSTVLPLIMKVYWGFISGLGTAAICPEWWLAIMGLEMVVLWHEKILDGWSLFAWFALFRLSHLHVANVPEMVRFVSVHDDVIVRVSARGAAFGMPHVEASVFLAGRNTYKPWQAGTVHSLFVIGN